MKLIITNTTPYQVPRQSFRRLFDKTLGILRRKNKHGVIEVSFVSDADIRTLNRQYRKKDAITDVLSFYFGSANEAEQQKEELYGQVIICPQQADRQKGSTICLRDELNTLFVHGILHIFGYDHENDEDFYTMQSLEKRILGSQYTKN